MEILIVSAVWIILFCFYVPAKWHRALSAWWEVSDE